MKIFTRTLCILRGQMFKVRYNIRGGRRLKIQSGVTIDMVSGSQILFGSNVGLYKNMGLYLDSSNAVLSIGNNTYINQRTEIKCMTKVEIGENCAIAWDVTITDTDYHIIDGQPISKPVCICDNVWIGCKVVILKGVTIGQGAVVNKDVPPYSLVAGVPAKIVRENVSWIR